MPSSPAFFPQEKARLKGDKKADAAPAHAGPEGASGRFALPAQLLRVRRRYPAGPALAARPSFPHLAPTPRLCPARRRPAA